MEDWFSTCSFNQTIISVKIFFTANSDLYDPDFRLLETCSNKPFSFFRLDRHIKIICPENEEAPWHMIYISQKALKPPQEELDQKIGLECPGHLLGIVLCW